VLSNSGPIHEVSIWLEKHWLSLVLVPAWAWL
jgi:hypothetical protein